MKLYKKHISGAIKCGNFKKNKTKRSTKKNPSSRFIYVHVFNNFYGRYLKSNNLWKKNYWGLFCAFLVGNMLFVSMKNVVSDKI